MNSEIFLLDTSSWIFFFRRGKDTHTLKTQRMVEELEKRGRVMTCGIILAELIQGLGSSKKEIKIRRMLEKHECFETSKEIYILAGELSRNLADKGFKTPLSDCLIAAITLVYGVTLVSDDPHFKRFIGLKLKFID